MIKQLEKEEYAPYYASYIELVPEGDFVPTLEEQIDEVTALFQGISDHQAQFRYAPEKWSIKEVIGHMADTERVMAYRLLSIARGDTAVLPGFNENVYNQHASFHHQPLKEIIQHFLAVRQSTIYLIKSLKSDDLLRRGIANHHDVSVRALIAIIAGHALHHCNIMKERYIASEQYPKS